MKTVRGLLVVLTFISLPIEALHSRDYHHCTDFYKPVICSPRGIRNFLTHIYNQPTYGHEFLPNNFSHFIQLLDHGKQTKQSKEYAKAVLRLLHNKLKSSTYINAYAFSEILGKLPQLLENYFIIYKSDNLLSNLQGVVYDLLYGTFKSHFGAFKKSPTVFLDHLSQEIVNTIEHENSHEVTVEELRKVLLVFLEISINKLVWSPQDGKETWESVKTIAQYITNLIEHNVLDDPDDLNDLFVSLIERYCFFLDITSADLPLDFYQYVKKDIGAHPLLLLELEEQEDYITPKSTILARGLLKAEAATRAYSYDNPAQQQS